MRTTMTMLSLLLLLVLGCDRSDPQPAPAPRSAKDVTALPVGATVPKLTLADADGRSFDLNAALAKQPTVLIFYRGGWCVFCNIQLGQLVKAEPKLTELGYQILAISPDRPEKLKESIEKHEMSYTLLSDSDLAAIKAFGLDFPIDDKTNELYRDKYNIDLEAASGRTHHVLPVPAVFLVSTKGEIRFAHADPNYKRRLDPDVLLAAARAALKPDLKP